MRKPSLCIKLCYPPQPRTHAKGILTHRKSPVSPSAHRPNAGVPHVRWQYNFCFDSTYIKQRAHSLCGASVCRWHSSVTNILGDRLMAACPELTSQVWGYDDAAQWRTLRPHPEKQFDGRHSLTYSLVQNQPPIINCWNRTFAASALFKLHFTYRLLSTFASSTLVQLRSLFFIRGV